MNTTDRILGGNLSRRAFLSRLAIIPGGSAWPAAPMPLPSHPLPYRRADGAVDTGGRSTANEDTHSRGITHV